MTDWRSYDHIARRYDAVWGSRFEAVARQMWAPIPPATGAIVLDIGTGTGIVPRTLGARVRQLAGVIGCDRSAGMLSLARATMPPLRVLAAEATALPFRHSIFDVATASFVLSHLLNYRAGLVEARRVLKPSGIFVMASWTANTDPYSHAWSELLAEAVSKDRLQEAVAQVAPSEGYFENAENVKTALTEAALPASKYIRSHWNVVFPSNSTLPTGNSVQVVGLLRTHSAPTDGIDSPRRHVTSFGARLGPTSTTVAGFLLVLGIGREGNAAEQSAGAVGAGDMEPPRLSAGR